MSRIKITVLRRMTNPDIVEEYMGDECRQDALPCGAFEDDQEFVVEDAGGPPEGFCGWAWTDIHKYVLAIVCGGDFAPWVKEKGTAIACCTDGYRPVVFKIETIDERE